MGSAQPVRFGCATTGVAVGVVASVGETPGSPAGGVTGSTGVTTISTAPTSQALPCGRVTPRWSVVTFAVQALLGTRSSSELVDAGSSVIVGPPLSASAPSWGSADVVVVPHEVSVT